MRKLVLLILFLFVLGTFSGCTAQNNVDGDTIEKKNGGTKVSVEKNDVDTTEKEDIVVEEIVDERVNEPIPVNDVSEFKNWLAQINIDLAKYKEIGSGSKSTIGYIRSVDLLQILSDKVDGKVLISDSSEITLPVSKNDLEALGWELFREEEDGVVQYRNSKGERIILMAQKDSDAQEKYTELSIEKKLNGEKIAPPWFCVAESINNSSSIQEVMAKFGEPIDIAYMKDGVKDMEESLVRVRFRGEEKSIWFYFSVRDNKILSVSIS